MCRGVVHFETLCEKGVKKTSHFPSPSKNQAWLPGLSGCHEVVNTISFFFFCSLYVFNIYYLCPVCCVSHGPQLSHCQVQCVESFFYYFWKGKSPAICGHWQRLVKVVSCSLHVVFSSIVCSFYSVFLYNFAKRRCSLSCKPLSCLFGGVFAHRERNGSFRFLFWGSRTRVVGSGRLQVRNIIPTTKQKELKMGSMG